MVHKSGQEKAERRKDPRNPKGTQKNMVHKSKVFLMLKWILSWSQSGPKLLSQQVITSAITNGLWCSQQSSIYLHGFTIYIYICIQIIWSQKTLALSLRPHIKKKKALLPKRLEQSRFCLCGHESRYKKNTQVQEALDSQPNSCMIVLAQTHSSFICTFLKSWDEIHSWLSLSSILYNMQSNACV